LKRCQNCQKIENFVTFCLLIDRFIKIAQRKMQILLYNLLNLARDGSIALCLIAKTTNTDIDSLLEKRVKSRFASRKNIIVARNWDLDMAIEYGEIC